MNIEPFRMTPAEISELAALAVEFTRLRQNECKHLCIENFGPEIFGKLVHEYIRAHMAPRVHINE